MIFFSKNRGSEEVGPASKTRFQTLRFYSGNYSTGGMIITIKDTYYFTDGMIITSNDTNYFTGMMMLITPGTNYIS